MIKSLNIFSRSITSGSRKKIRQTATLCMKLCLMVVNNSNKIWCKKDIKVF